jgi:hypothetical protein
MSEIGLKRTNLLNNDSIAGNKRFDGLSSGARRVATGGDVRGIDRDRAVEAGPKPVRQVVLSSTPFFLRECQIGSEGIRIGLVRVAREALGRGPGGSRPRSEAVLDTNVLQFG